jgi:hypothetical protein
MSAVYVTGCFFDIYRLVRSLQSVLSCQGMFPSNVIAVLVTFFCEPVCGTEGSPAVLHVWCAGAGSGWLLGFGDAGRTMLGAGYATRHVMTDQCRIYQLSGIMLLVVHTVLWGQCALDALV